MTLFCNEGRFLFFGAGGGDRSFAVLEALPIVVRLRGSGLPLTRGKKFVYGIRAFQKTS
jgi:hypothetical protein